jgi:UDP-N-acetylmuramate--alanine ligase
MKMTDVISKVKVKNFKTEFTLSGNKVLLNVLGYHNVYNSTAAIIASNLIFDNTEKIIKSVSSFSGVKRRLELKYDKSFIVFDDYGHHPSEVKTTLISLKENDKGRLIVVFQPHTYSRLKKFYKEFAKALEIADVVYLLPIYPAREKEIKGVKSELIFNILNKKKNNVFLIENTDELYTHLKKQIKKNDRVVFQGAGTVTNFCDEFIKRIKAK